LRHWLVQPSVSSALPSSHCSPASSWPLPQPAPSVQVTSTVCASLQSAAERAACA
jgi:hypothetical protein